MLMGVPFTVLMTFEDNEYLDSITLVVRKICLTFDTATRMIYHPFNTLPRFESESDSWPPTPLAQTSFAAGAGISLVATGGVQGFRALVQFIDKPNGLKRTADSATLKISRTCVCSLKDTDDKTTFKLVQNGPLEITSRLLAIKKDDFAHVVLAWRNAAHLTLIAAYPLEASDVPGFKKFFQRELHLHSEMFSAGSGHVLPSSSDNGDPMTPMTVRQAAQSAAEKNAMACVFGSNPIEMD